MFMCVRASASIHDSALCQCVRLAFVRALAHCVNIIACLFNKLFVSTSICVSKLEKIAEKHLLCALALTSQLNKTQSSKKVSFVFFLLQIKAVMFA